MSNIQKLKTSFSLSVECKRLLKLLSERLGISQASVIEMLVRETARREGIDAGNKES